MGSFYLHKKSIETEVYNLFKCGMLELASIEKEQVDEFLKNDSIYQTVHYSELFNNHGPEEQIIIKFIEKLTSVQNEIIAIESLNNHNLEGPNAFLGIDFCDTTVPENFQITNDTNYKIFKNKQLWDVTSKTLFDKSQALFPNLELCGDVKNQLQKLGDGSYFSQILSRLTELNKAAGDWTNNGFSYRKVCENYALNISPESQQTMDNHGDERLFSLPNGERKHFELHVKTGNFRFHFYPDVRNFMIYVGYIGPHLTTWSN